MLRPDSLPRDGCGRVGSKSPQIAQQRVVVGETYDYEFTPGLPGTLTLELRNGGGVLLVDQKIEVVN